MPVQAKPELIEYRNRLKFSTIFQYTVTDHTMADVEGDNYFHSLSSNYLRPGDELYVCVREPSAGIWYKAVFEVLNVTSTHTGVVQISEWRSTGQLISEPETGLKPPQKPAKRVNPPPKAA